MNQIKGLAMLSDDCPVFKNMPLVMREAANYLRKKEKNEKKKGPIAETVKQTIVPF